VTAIAATHFPSLTDPRGARFRTTWAKLCARLETPIVSADKRVAGLSLATFAGDKRALANVERVYACGLDLDEAVDLDSLRERFVGTDAFVHTTHSSTIAAPRCRVFLRLSRPVTGDEYRRVYQAIASKVEADGLVVDRAASDPSRFWYLPSIPPGGAMVHWTCTGAPVDVDAALAAVPAPAPYVPAPRAPSSADGYARARAYLHHVPGAVSGSGGSTATFLVAQRLVRGFSLSVEDALHLLASEWNERCCPPWDERGLRRKVEDAARSGRMADGDLLDRERTR